MDIIVTADGRFTWNGGSFRCAIGKSGMTADKREGDHASPVGCWPIRRALYRPDKFATSPATALPIAPIAPNDGWCDAPDHPDYNRPVKLPHPASCERMWRDDGLYDVVVILGHNDDPPVAGMGSAIFLHVAKPDYSGTEGCVALALPDLLAVLEAIKPGDRLCIQSWRDERLG